MTLFNPLPDDESPQEWQARALELKPRSEGATTAIAGRAPGFIIDVPITLSVAVRGATEAEAMEIARDFADGLDPTDDYVRGYMDERRRQGVKWEITEVSLESNTEDSCEVLEELEEDEEGDEQ